MGINEPLAPGACGPSPDVDDSVGGVRPPAVTDGQGADSSPGPEPSPKQVLAAALRGSRDKQEELAVMAFFAALGLGAAPPPRGAAREGADVGDALAPLLEGVEGEEWPRWLGHLPWDVRAYYKRVVQHARAVLPEPKAEATSCRTCGTPEPDDPCYDCGTVSPTHADEREAAALRFPPKPEGWEPPSVRDVTGEGER